MTTEQVYKLAGTENELLSHIEYFWHFTIEGSVVTGLREDMRSSGRRVCMMH